MSKAMAVVLPNDWAPRHYQQGIMDYFDAGGKRAVWVVHRRGGKDSTMLNQTAKMAMQRVGTYWHLLPTLRQGRKVVWDGIDFHGRRMIDQAFPTAIRTKVNNMEMSIHLANGSIFQVVGSDNFDSLVGSNPVHVTFSEWPLSKPSAWNFVRPILAENGGTAAFIYTPRGRNHGYATLKIAQQSTDWFWQVMGIDVTGALPMSTLDDERATGMPEELVQQEYMCDFNAARTGSIYGDLVMDIDLVHTEFTYDNVYTAWDLGFTDSTAIWWFRIDEKGNVTFLEYFEAHGLPINYYADLILSKPYKYKMHWLPHDGNDSRFKYATGLTIREQLRPYLPNTAVTPKLSVSDGIQASRKLLATRPIFDVKCKNGLSMLESYKRKYDEDTHTYSDQPEHGAESHGSDAFRYAAVVIDVIKTMQKPEPEKPKAVMTLDNLWEDQKQQYSGRI